MTAQRTAGPYSVVNGKLFRDGATCRLEVPLTLARDGLNAYESAVKQRDELVAALRRALNFKAGDYQNGQGWEQMARAAMDEAQANVLNLAMRWTQVRDVRVVESADPANYRWDFKTGLIAL